MPKLPPPLTTPPTDTPATSQQRLVRDFVGVRSHPTVVRLDHLEARDADWITSSYYLTSDVKRYLASLEDLLSRPTGTGAFLIGPYGSGKSHFLAYLARRLQVGAPGKSPPEVAMISLVNFRSTVPLEQAVADACGVKLADADRRLAWQALAQRCPHGLLLILDELSEFLRSKPDRRSFNEDVRFLQFLGEWAQGSRFWVLAALQEHIEQTGEIEHEIYRKIKDRFPHRLLLSPAHVKDILAESIIIKKDGYDDAVQSVVRELREAFPQAASEFAELAAIYPLHPATLRFLEEIRGGFSQARGAIEFAATQLAGDSARGIAPFIDRPWGSLLGPDAIVDHFQDLLEVQPEHVALAQKFFPHYRRHLKDLFETESLRALAWKILKLLVLTHLSPERQGLTAAEAASFLLHRVSRTSADTNVRAMERVLAILAEKGRYIANRAGVYAINLEDDGGAALERAIEREKSNLRERGDSLFDDFLQLLKDDDFARGRFPRDRWQPCKIRWHLHERTCSFWLGNDDPAAREGDNLAVVVRLPWGTTEAASRSHTVVPARLKLGEEHLELAALMRVRERPWPEGTRKRLEKRLEERVAVLRSQLRSAYLQGTLVNSMGEPTLLPRSDANVSFEAWLDLVAELVLKRTYSRFEHYAPSAGPLHSDSYRLFLRFATTNDLVEPVADDTVNLIREGYLVPMGLLRHRGREYVMPENPEKNELVQVILPLLDHQPEPRLIYERLAEPVFGLVPDQVGILLVYLCVLGEIDILKGQNSLRDAFETLANPIHYDKVVHGSALRLEQIRELDKLCQSLDARPPKQWTVLAQRQAIRRVRDAGKPRLERLQQLFLKLEELGQARELQEKLGRLLRAWGVLERGETELQSFQQFLFEVGSASRFLSDLGDVQALPERIETLLSEIQRLQHVLSQPLVAAWPDEKVKILVEALEETPGLDRPDAVEGWISRARSACAAFKDAYTRRHETWWKEASSREAWTYEPPRLASSRHLGLAAEIEAIRGAQEKAQRARCRGLAGLDFQPQCSCGFDGERSPAATELDGIDHVRQQIDTTLERFFDDKQVRARLKKWAEEGVELNTETLEYLEGKRPYPRVDKLELFDRHLAGVELVKELSVEQVVGVLEERTWERRALLAELEKLFAASGSDRVRFARGSKASKEPIFAWCAEQAMRTGASLPAGLKATELKIITAALDPRWVGAEALRNLDALGLDDTGLDQMAGWILDGSIRVPRGGARLAPLVEAMTQIILPADPEDAAGLARLSELLYRTHARGLRVAGDAWLDRLERLATTPIPELPPPLTETLRRGAESQWLVLDCLGLPLLAAIERELGALLPSWRLAAVEFALVGETTTTDAFYAHVLGAGIEHAFEKLNAVDALFHERFLPLDDMARLALAELRASSKGVLRRLDPGRPLLVFADHGFRIARDGKSFTHGGSSFLERIVPVLWLEV